MTIHQLTQLEARRLTAHLPETVPMIVLNTDNKPVCIDGQARMIALKATETDSQNETQEKATCLYCGCEDCKCFDQ